MAPNEALPSYIPPQRVKCRFQDKNGAEYHAIQEAVNNDFNIDYDRWRVVGPAPWGGNCPSLKLSDPTCVLCPSGSLRTGAPLGCLPNPGGMFFADPGLFPVGFKVPVNCSLTIYDSPTCTRCTGYQPAWNATIIQEAGVPAPAPAPATRLPA
ncbi:hypothetical protein WJX72_002214 [[Myrmecia] bisecta]|uniref:Uncharacterized protein n=1 Tax=[Myrmecia] bisecta TaxID=41462 RepID=A0AAW1PD54_9CHLO